MSFWSSLAKVGGAVGGFALGGPAGAAAGYGLGSIASGGGGSSSSGTGGRQGGMDAATAQQGQYAQTDRNRYLGALGGGQQALDTSTQAAISSGMPQLNQNLQSSREDAIRRGISTGDLGTSNEGDIYSAFQRNIANSTAGQAMNLYNTQAQSYGNLATNSGNNYLDLLTGGLDRQQQQTNQKTSFWNSLISAGGQAAGAYLGNR